MNGLFYDLVITKTGRRALIMDFDTREVLDCEDYPDDLYLWMTSNQLAMDILLSVRACGVE